MLNLVHAQMLETSIIEKITQTIKEIKNGFANPKEQMNASEQQFSRSEFFATLLEKLQNPQPFSMTNPQP